MARREKAAELVRERWMPSTAPSRAASSPTRIRLLGDFDLAEEALHDASRAALEHWPREGARQSAGVARVSL